MPDARPGTTLRGCCRAWLDGFAGRYAEVLPVCGGEVAGMAVADVVGDILNAPALSEVLPGQLHAALAQVAHDADTIGLLELLAQGLLEYETLNGDEIRIIVEGGTLSRKDETDDDTPAPRAKKTRSGLPTGGRSRTRPDPDTPGSEPV